MDIRPSKQQVTRFGGSSTTGRAQNVASGAAGSLEERAGQEERSGTVDCCESGRTSSLESESDELHPFDSLCRGNTILERVVRVT